METCVISEMPIPACPLETFLGFSPGGLAQHSGGVHTPFPSATLASAPGILAEGWGPPLGRKLGGGRTIPVESQF